MTVDHDGLEGDNTTVTLRERDSADQIRLPAGDLAAELEPLLAGDRAFADLRETHRTVDTDVTTT